MDIDAIKQSVLLRMETEGLNPRQLSLKAGLSATYVRDLVQGRSKNPKSEHLNKLAIALGTDLDGLLRIVEKGNSPVHRTLTDEIDTATAFLTPESVKFLGSADKASALMLMTLQLFIDALEKRRSDKAMVEPVLISHGIVLSQAAFLDLFKEVGETEEFKSALYAYIDLYIEMLVASPQVAHASIDAVTANLIAYHEAEEDKKTKAS